MSQGHATVEQALKDRKQSNWITRRIVVNATERDIGMKREVTNIVLNKE
jgi:hypothetical protein